MKKGNWCIVIECRAEREAGVPMSLHSIARKYTSESYEFVSSPPPS